MKVLIPQGLIGRPNYFGLLNNSMTLIICESLRQIGEMACVMSAWSSRGQTLNTIARSLLLHSVFKGKDNRDFLSKDMNKSSRCPRARNLNAT